MAPRPTNGRILVAWRPRVQLPISPRYLSPDDSASSLPLPGLRPGVALIGEGDDAELRDLRLGQVVKLGEVATEFDAIHSVQRAQEVGSVHRIIPPSTLRPYLVEALERATTGAEG